LQSTRINIEFASKNFATTTLTTFIIIWTCRVMGRAAELNETMIQGAAVVSVCVQGVKGHANWGLPF